MIIALTGLHSAGKSYFTKNIPPKYGFEVVSKKHLVEYICKQETGRVDWQVWYKEEYNNNPYQMTGKILSYLPLNKNIILDAVHSNLEWYIICSIFPNSVLAMVTTFKEDRQERWREQSNLDEKDQQRIFYWHSPDFKEECLLTKVSWTFNGSASLQLNELSFVELLNYLKIYERDSIHEKEFQLKIEKK